MSEFKIGDYVTDIHEIVLVKITVEPENDGVILGENIKGGFEVVVDPIIVKDPAEFLLGDYYVRDPVKLRRKNGWNDILDEIEKRQEEEPDAHRRNPDFCAKCGGECYFDDDGKRILENQGGE